MSESDRPKIVLTTGTTRTGRHAGSGDLVICFGMQGGGEHCIRFPATAVGDVLKAVMATVDLAAQDIVTPHSVSSKNDGQRWKIGLQPATGDLAVAFELSPGVDIAFSVPINQAPALRTRIAEVERAFASDGPTMRH